MTNTTARTAARNATLTVSIAAMILGIGALATGNHLGGRASCDVDRREGLLACAGQAIRRLTA